MKLDARNKQVALAVAGVLSAAAMSAVHAGGVVTPPKVDTAGTYVAGDIHNHSTCSDGSISMQKLIRKSTDTTDTPWGLDWFVQAGHGGNGNRNCMLAEDATLATPAFPLVFAADGTTIQGPNTSWQNTNPAINPKGRVQGNPPNQVMWRWQSVQEYQYPITEYLAALKGQPLFIGLESVVAGHEHTSMSVITGQLPASVYTQSLPTSPGYSPLGNATALSQWSYCFDRGDTDTSRGNTVVGGSVGNNWNCSVTGSANSTDPSWDAVAQKLAQPGGAGTGNRGHAKTVEAMKWLAENHADGSYYIPTHLERAGPFNPNGNNGFNVEHLRNFNNAAPTVAFGMETQPGHGASDARGEYTVHRNNFGGAIGNVDSVGGTTWGGTGVYGAQVGGVWDALLGEGRNFWFFSSSDWHNRGSFGPDDRRSSQDFYPGEYQRMFIKVADDASNASGVITPASVVNGMRTGNVWAATGQLIDRLAFVVCEAAPGLTPAKAESAALAAARKNDDVDLAGNCATMGEKLHVAPGADLVVAIAVRDPSGRNYSPYTFANPSLVQIGMDDALNKPVLHRIHVIGGSVTGFKQPGSADYSGQWPNTWISNPDMATVPAGAKNTSASVQRTFNWHNWKVANSDYRTMAYRVRGVNSSQYLRLRGSNLPESVPFETDADGNPLADLWTNATGINPTLPGGSDGVPANANLRIPCTTVGTNVPENGVTYTGTTIDGCPAHLPVVNGVKYSAYDVAAWSDLWFYSNPVFIEVRGSTLVAGVK